MITSSSVIVILKDKMSEPSFQSLFNSAHFDIYKIIIVIINNCFIRSTQLLNLASQRSSKSPFQFILVVIKKYKNPIKVRNPVFLHHVGPVNAPKIHKVLPSIIRAVTINISRSLFQVLFWMPRWKRNNWCIWHSLPQNPSWMSFESTTLDHQIWLQPAGNKPKPKAVVKTHPIHVVLNWPGFIYRNKLF